MLEELLLDQDRAAGFSLSSQGMTESLRDSLDSSSSEGEHD